MNKTKKALASLAIAGMVLSMAPVSVFAADEDTRLAGADRYLTSIKIAEKAYASADTAVVAAGNPNNLVDALAAAPLAAQEDAPIYLTDKADMNDDVVKSMKALGVDKVIVVGAAASKAVVDELKAAGFEVEEVKGAGRVETAEAINAKLTAPAGTFVVGYDGVADAMSVASYAAANNYAIVVTNQNGVANGTVDADYIVGGTTRVKDIAGAKRLAGADRYDTNKQVIAELDFDFGKVYVGNGLTLADALVGSVLAAQTNSPIALTDGKTVKADVASNLTDDSVVVALGGTAAVSNAVVDAVKNPPSTGEFKVESVTAKAANAFQVKFGKAPADASKVTFEVKRNSTPVTVSATWDGAVATLTSSQKFPEGDYTVAVKEGEKDLGSSTVKITAQKIAKIEITSSKLGVTSVTTGYGMGYATYKVEDQYGNDITTESMANSLTFQSGVGNVQGRDGILTVTPNINILQFNTVVITGYDSNTGVSVSASLAVSTQVGTLSDIKLNALTNADDKELTAGDISTLFYATYTATDISGNPTSDFNMVKEGLILNDDDELQTSSPYVKAKVVADPADSKKAAIQVWVDDTSSISMDMPVVITAMTYTGKTSQLNVTLKKAATVDAFTIMAPAYDIATGESKEIPFVAYDQNGVQITKASELESVNLSSNLERRVNVDGTLKLMLKEQSNHGNQVLTAMTPTGKYSSITINIQKAAYADKLVLDSSVLVAAMQNGAVQEIDLGDDDKGLQVKDQYGRDMDLLTKNYGYYVVASSSQGAPFTVSGTAQGAQDIVIAANAAEGSGTVTFVLKDRNVQVNGSDKVIDTKSASISVIKNSEIKGYTLAAVDEPIYTSTTSGVLTYDEAKANEQAYSANPEVYGLTGSGAKVLLADGAIDSAYVDSDDFVVTYGAGYDSVEVVAKKFADSTKKEGSTTLTVVVKTPSGSYKTLTTPIKSTNVAPVASTIDIEVKNKLVNGTDSSGVSFSNGDTVTVNTAIADVSTFIGDYITKFNENGDALATNEKQAPFVFFAKDQYGTKALKLANIYVDDATEVDENGTNVQNPPVKFDIDPATKKITVFGTVDEGHTYTVKVTGITTNGLIKTIQLKITHVTPQ